MFTRYHEPYLKPGKSERDILPQNLDGYDSWCVPRRFRQVDEKVYASSLILPHHISILRSQYWIKHVISLIHGDWLQEYYHGTDISIHQFPHLGRYIPKENIIKILGLIDDLDEKVVVHCLKWKIRTGKIIALHEMQNMWKSKAEAMLRYMKTSWWNRVNVNNFIETFLHDYS